MGGVEEHPGRWCAFPGGRERRGGNADQADHETDARRRERSHPAEQAVPGAAGSSAAGRAVTGRYSSGGANQASWSRPLSVTLRDLLHRPPCRYRYPRGPGAWVRPAFMRTAAKTAAAARMPAATAVATE